MLHQEFEHIYHSLEMMEDKTNGSKSKEYSTGEDRLANFKEICDFVGEDITLTPSMLAFLFMMKHIQSLKNAMVKNDMDRNNWCFRTSPESGSHEGHKQRLVDIRVYCALLDACVEEQLKDRPQE